MNNINQPRQRLKTISQRLRLIVNEINRLRDSLEMLPLGIERISFEIGHNYTDIVEGWFNGTLEPSFKDLSELATYFYCNNDYLCFGEKQPFIVDDLDIFSLGKVKGETLYNDIEVFLLELLKPISARFKLKNIYLIRCNNEFGQVGIVKIFDSYEYRAYLTDLHLIADKTYIDELHLFAFICKQLSTHSKDIKQFGIHSCLLDETSFYRIFSGEVPALSLITDKHLYFKENHWLDGFWLNNQNQVYWNNSDLLSKMLSSSEHSSKVKKTINYYLDNYKNSGFLYQSISST